MKRQNHFFWDFTMCRQWHAQCAGSDTHNVLAVMRTMCRQWHAQCAGSDTHNEHVIDGHAIITKFNSYKDRVQSKL